MARGSRSLRVETVSLPSPSCVLMASVLLTAVQINTQMSHFTWAVYPRVLWSREVLLCIGWVKVRDLGPSWLLEVLRN